MTLLAKGAETKAGSSTLPDVRPSGSAGIPLDPEVVIVTPVGLARIVFHPVRIVIRVLPCGSEAGRGRRRRDIRSRGTGGRGRGGEGWIPRGRGRGVEGR